MSEEFNYLEDAEINPDQLDVEWMHQADLAVRYGDNWAEHKRVVAECEEKIKLVRSDLVSKIMLKPSKYIKGTIKPTGPTAPQVEAAYRKHPKHIAAKNAWLTALYKLDLAGIAKNEISFTRKAALENLVKLHGQNYFAGPQVPRDLSKATDKFRKERRKETNKKVSRKRTK